VYNNKDLTESHDMQQILYNIDRIRVTDELLQWLRDGVQNSHNYVDLFASQLAIYCNANATI